MAHWPEHLAEAAPDGKPVAYMGAAWASRALWLVRHDPRIKSAVADSDVSLLVNIDHAPAGRAKHLFVHFVDGQLTDHYIGDGSGRPSVPTPDFEIRGEYATFREIQDGHLDGRKALLLGRLRLHGSMLRAVRLMGALETVVAVLMEIPCTAD